MRLFQAALDTCLDSPFSASLSVHCALHGLRALERCFLAFTFVMERQISSPKFSFASTFAMNMMGTDTPQLQATLMKTCRDFLSLSLSAWLRKRAEYCFESTVSEERTHWVLRQTRWVLRKTRWVCFGTQIIGWEELTEFAPRNSVRPKRLTEFGVWNRTPRNRIARERLYICYKKLHMVSSVVGSAKKMVIDQKSIYIYMLWSYYLGQVWPFQVLLSGPSRCYYLGQVVFSL